MKVWNLGDKMDEAIQKTTVKKRDRAEDIFFFTLAIASIGILVYIWLQPWAYVQTGGALGIAIFPTAFITVLLITSVVALFRQKEGSKRPSEGERVSFWPVFLLSGGIIAGTFGLWNFDPTISSGALVLFLLLVAGIRDWRLLAGLPIGMGLLIYILFIRVLGVYFPAKWF